VFQHEAPQTSQPRQRSRAHAQNPLNHQSRPEAGSRVRAVVPGMGNTIIQLCVVAIGWFSPAPRRPRRGWVPVSALQIPQPGPKARESAWRQVAFYGMRCRQRVVPASQVAVIVLGREGAALGSM
jgi:hypothetical protein